ncbi:MAG: DUF5615 family PIN-like protein [Chloroflexi bacterium]|nr:DUF5615 family PIN-like protein [Chloroflexota bacterium]
MRLLLDSSIWSQTVEDLRRAGHDIAWVGEWPRDLGDRAILEAAHREGHILVTIDKDFGELAVRRGLPHVGIVRLVLTPVAEEARLCERILALHGTELTTGAIVTASPQRIRIRLPDR